MKYNKGIDAQIDSTRQKDIQENRNFVNRLIKTVEYLVRQNASFRDLIAKSDVLVWILIVMGIEISRAAKLRNFLH